MIFTMYSIALILLLNTSSIDYGIKGCDDSNITILEEFQTSVEYLEKTQILFKDGTFKLRGFLLPACSMVNVKVQIEFDVSSKGKIENYKIIESTPRRIADKEVKRALYHAELYESAFGSKKNRIIVHYLQFKQKT